MAQQMSSQEQERRAISKALQLLGAVRVERVRFGFYRVESATRSGTVHVVTGTAPDGSDLACTCEARRRAACWHRALIWALRLRSQGVRVVSPDPAAPAAELPANVTRLAVRRAA